MNAPIELTEEVLAQAAASATARQATPTAAQADEVAKTRLARANMPGVAQAAEVKVTLGVVHGMVKFPFPLSDPVAQETWRCFAYERAQTIAEKTGVAGIDVTKVVNSAQSIAQKHAVMAVQEARRKLGVREGIEARMTLAVLQAMSDVPFPMNDAIAAEGWRCAAFEKAEAIAEETGAWCGIDVNNVVTRAQKAAYNQAVLDSQTFEQQQQEQAALDQRWNDAAYGLGLASIDEAYESYATVEDAETALATVQAYDAAEAAVKERRNKGLALATGGALTIAAVAGNAWPVMEEEKTTDKILSKKGEWIERPRIRERQRFNYGAAALAGTGAFIAVFAAADWLGNNGSGIREGMSLLRFFRGFGG
jgi:hypothetical protein